MFLGSGGLGPVMPAAGAAPGPGTVRRQRPWHCLSLSQREWHWREGNDRIGLGIATRLDVPEIVGRILAARGIGIDEAASFLDPTLRALLPDPSCLADMDAAAARLARAVRAGETIGVFGDYDVDGACATAIVTIALRGLGCPVVTHVPDRMREGYGPNEAALRGLMAAGATLLICVDCGTAAGAILEAVGQGADIVVLDHHKADGPPPRILATVNPNRLDDASGMGALCAAGVSFLTLVAMLRVLRAEGFFAGRAEPDLRALLDLVALATVCDVVPLLGLNRAFVRQGLAVLRQGARPGIAALLAVAGTRGPPDAGACGFGLGPRINAGGRIGEAGLGLALLLEQDPDAAQQIALRLDTVNRERRELEAAITREAIASAEAQVAAGRFVLLVSAAGWHPGVVGIAAARLKERFHRPACVGGWAEGAVKGSGRSVPGADLGAAVIAARQAGLLTAGGGHAMAAGFTYAPGREAALHDFLADRLPRPEGLPARPHLEIEASVSVRGATAGLAEKIAQLAPFGAGNDEPMLVVPSVRAARADWIGQDRGTLRAILVDESGGRLKALMFRAREDPVAQALVDRTGGALHLAGHLRAEAWNGSVEACFFVRDGVAA